MLLSHIGREWKIIELAAEAKVSPATASKVVGALVREALAEYLGRGPQKTMRLVAPARLLDEWARDWRLGRRGKTGYYCLARNPDELKQRLAEAARQVGARLGFTLAAGADFYGPYIRDDIIHAHFVGLERDFAEAAGLQPALSGANIILYHARDEGILYLPDKLRDQLKLPEDHAAGPVCPVQLYLDMKAARGRYAEQAEKLRQEVIGY